MGILFWRNLIGRSPTQCTTRAMSVAGGEVTENGSLRSEFSLEITYCLIPFTGYRHTNTGLVQFKYTNIEM